MALLGVRCRTEKQRTQTGAPHCKFPQERLHSPSLPAVICHQWRAYVACFQLRQPSQSTASCLYRAARHPAKAIALQECLGFTGNILVWQQSSGVIAQTESKCCSQHTCDTALNFHSENSIYKHLSSRTLCCRSCTAACAGAAPAKKEFLCVTIISTRKPVSLIPDRCEFASQVFRKQVHSTKVDLATILQHLNPSITQTQISAHSMGVEMLIINTHKSLHRTQNRTGFFPQ